MRTARSSSRPAGLHQAPHWDQAHPGTRHPLPDQAPPRDQAHPPWTGWQTGVNILPCPKIRLLAVIIMNELTIGTELHLWPATSGISNCIYFSVLFV